MNNIVNQNIPSTGICKSKEAKPDGHFETFLASPIKIYVLINMYDTYAMDILVQYLFLYNTIMCKWMQPLIQRRHCIGGCISHNVMLQYEYIL